MELGLRNMILRRLNFERAVGNFRESYKSLRKRLLIKATVGKKVWLTMSKSSKESRRQKSITISNMFTAATRRTEVIKILTIKSHE